MQINLNEFKEKFENNIKNLRLYYNGLIKESPDVILSDTWYYDPKFTLNDNKIKVSDNENSIKNIYMILNDIKKQLNTLVYNIKL
jgi:hypothetical protein